MLAGGLIATLLIRNFFSPFSFDHFLKEKIFEHYIKVCFKLVEREIGFHRIFKWLRIAFLANKFLVRYERFFSFIIRPHNIHLTLMALKTPHQTGSAEK